MRITLKFLQEWVEELNGPKKQKIGSLKLIYNGAYGFGIRMGGGSYRSISSMGMTAKEAEAWLYGYREGKNASEYRIKSD